MKIDSATINFLKELKDNNNKEWFDENRKRYEIARGNFSDLIASVITQMKQFDHSLEGLEVKQTLFRINRDVRFSKNKSPYKTNFAASITAGGKKIARAGYYFHMDPDEMFYGGGWYMPDATSLAAIRQEVDYNLKDFDAILKKKSFKNIYSGLDDFKLKTKPKGYEVDNPAIEHLRQKSFIASATVTRKEVEKEGFDKLLVNAFENLYPLVAFLNKAVD